MKILTLDGGGTLGLITLTILEQFEKTINKPLYKYFDLISGVSTGSLIGSLIAKGNTASEAKKLYIDNIPYIFEDPQPMWKFWKTKYDAKRLEESTKKLLNFNMAESKTRLMFHAVKINDGDVIRPKFWKSWEDIETNVGDVVRASCSAPTYFEPAVIDGNVYIDGGLATNDVSMCALAEGIKLNGCISDNIKILNISTYKMNGYKKAKDIKFIWQWIDKIAPVTLAASSPLASYQTKQIIGSRFLEISPDFNADLDFMNLEKLIQIGNETWSKTNRELINWSI